MVVPITRFFRRCTLMPTSRNRMGSRVEWLPEDVVHEGLVIKLQNDTGKWEEWKIIYSAVRMSKEQIEKTENWRN